MADSALVNALIGRSVQLPPAVLCRFPELAEAHWRCGGMFVRVGSWCLGQSSAAAITLGRAVWIAPGVALEAELLLHELRHVHQFKASFAFPALYLWESIRRGYHKNRFEVDARGFAARRLAGSF